MTETLPAANSTMEGIRERREFGTIVIGPSNGRAFRRLIYVDSYGGEDMWEQIKTGMVAPHHLRGCLQLARRGYDVALVEPVKDFWIFRKKPFPHDLSFFRLAKSWLGRDGIIFCGHNVLAWMPFLRQWGLLRCRVVSHLFGDEHLPVRRGHDGVIALTPPAAETARRLAPRAKVAHLSWGTDLSVFPDLPYNPAAFFSCGITLRDFATVSKAAAKCRQKIQVLCPGLPEGLVWPPNVELIDGGKEKNFVRKKLSYQELLHKHYGSSAGSLVILKNHRWTEETVAGFTEIIEVMAMARPIILTRSKAFNAEIDIEKAGWGIYVPFDDSEAIAEAIEFLANDPRKAEEMGRNGRKLAESYYNIERYADDLHKFFESL